MKSLERNEYQTLTSFYFSDLFTVKDLFQINKKIKNFEKIKSIINQFPEYPFKFYLQKIKDNLKDHDGYGIYFFTDKLKQNSCRLVYIGIRADKKTLNKGFHEQRLYKHLHTDTFRFIHGFSLGKNKEIPYSQTIQRLKQYTRNDFQGLNNSMTLCKLVEDYSNFWFWRDQTKAWKDYSKFNLSGLVTSFQRFAYACHNWDYFCNDKNITDEAFDKNFNFFFIKFKESYFIDKKIEEIKKELQRIEDRLVLKFRPITNGEKRYKIIGNTADRIEYWSNKSQIENSNIIAHDIFNEVSKLSL